LGGTVGGWVKNRGQEGVVGSKEQWNYDQQARWTRVCEVLPIPKVLRKNKTPGARDGGGAGRGPVTRGVDCNKKKNGRRKARYGPGYSDQKRGGLVVNRY